MGNWISGDSMVDYPITLRKNTTWIPDLVDRRDLWVILKDNKCDLTDVDMTSMFVNIRSQNDWNLHIDVACSVLSVYMYMLSKKDRASTSLFLSEFSFNGATNTHDALERHKGIMVKEDVNVLFHYFHERLIRDTQNYNSGSSIRDSLKVINKIGVLPENKYTNPTKPPLSTPFKADGDIIYKRVNKNDLKLTLQNGYPIIFGYSIYESYNKENEKMIGGKCGIICGFNKDYFIIVTPESNNPIHMTHDYIMESGSDFWIIEPHSQFIRKDPLVANETSNESRAITNESGVITGTDTSLPSEVICQIRKDVY